MVARLMLVRMLLGAGLMAPAAAGQEERATTLPAATLPAVTSDLGSLVRFVVGDGSLGMWGTAEPPLTRVDVPGVGQATVTGRPGSFYVHVRLGPPDAGDNNTVSFRQTAAMLSVTLNVYDAQGRAQKSVTLSQAVEDPQAARQMRFVARAELRTGQSHLSLKSVSELRRGHADAYRRFLAPLWRDLGRWGVLRVDEDLAGDIHADGEVDDAMRRQVERLLADLDVEDFSRRESAHKELIALGRPWRC